MKSFISISLFLLFISSYAFALDNDKGSENGFEWIDLGLPSGTKWATVNIGANAPEEEGQYFKWAEVVADQTSDKKQDESLSFNRLLNDIGANEEFDAARHIWGGQWKIPSVENIKELIDNCEWEFIAETDRHGFEVTGPNGNSIFLPAAGFMEEFGIMKTNTMGGYWSSEASSNDRSSAYYLGIADPWTPDGDLDDSETHSILNTQRWFGLSVRPVITPLPLLAEVKEKEDLSRILENLRIHTGISWVDLNLPSGTKWAKVNLGANASHDLGSAYSLSQIFPWEFDFKDPVKAKWDFPYHTPTEIEWKELVENCDSIHRWMNIGNKKVQVITFLRKGLTVGKDRLKNFSASELDDVSIDIPFVDTLKYVSNKNAEVINQEVVHYYWSWGNNEKGQKYIVRPVFNSDFQEPLSMFELLTKPMDNVNGYEYVDLGLPSGTKWALHNFGSTELKDAGRYFHEKELLNDLEKGFDMVNNAWGGKWQIPDKEDWEELIKYCKFYEVDSPYLTDDWKNYTLAVGPNNKVIVFVRYQDFFGRDKLSGKPTIYKYHFGDPIPENIAYKDLIRIRPILK